MPERPPRRAAGARAEHRWHRPARQAPRRGAARARLPGRRVRSGHDHRRARLRPSREARSPGRARADRRARSRCTVGDPPGAAPGGGPGRPRRTRMACGPEPAAWRSSRARRWSSPGTTRARRAGRGAGPTAALARYVARSTDLTLAASDDLAADARRRRREAGPQRLRSRRRHFPPRAAAPDAVRAELGVGARSLVLAVGRLHRQKRFDVLVAAAATWADDNDLPYVVIAGEGPERAALAAQIASDPRTGGAARRPRRHRGPARRGRCRRPAERVGGAGAGRPGGTCGPASRWSRPASAGCPRWSATRR